MQLTHEREGENLVIFIRDELDHHGARRMIDEMDSLTVLYPTEPVILDLSGLTFMDSSGLAVAINLYRALARTGRRLIVRGTPPQPMRVFRAAGLQKMMTFIDGEGQVQC